MILTDKHSEIHKTKTRYFKQSLSLSVSFSLDKLSEDVLEDTSVLIVSNFDISIKSDLNLEGFTSACFHSESLINLKVATVEVDIECFMSIESKGISVLSVDEFSREDTHTNEI